MLDKYCERVAKEIGAEIKHVKNVVQLLREENTVPFIARYRKEVTGGLDETSLFLIEKKHQYYSNLAERILTILEKIKTQGKLNADLEKQIRETDKLVELEDLYLPFKSKRKTLASEAIEKGLLPLAEEILAGKIKDNKILKKKAEKFIDKSKELPDVAAVLLGVKHIIAEKIVMNSEIRETVRSAFTRYGNITSTKAKEKTKKVEGKSEKSKKKSDKDTTKNKKGDNSTKTKESTYSLYFEFYCKIGRAQPHQILALNRGEEQGELKVSITIEPDDMQDKIFYKLKLGNYQNFGDQVQKLIFESIKAGYDRLKKSICNEIRSDLTEKAQQHALTVFAHNLERILLTPPLGARKLFAIDPGIRTGCKYAVLGEYGAVLESGVIYPNSAEGETTFVSLMEEYQVDLVVIGNGTAGRETEEWVAGIVEKEKKKKKKTFWESVEHSIVSEAGASVYSVSEVAKEEFPDLDCTMRGTISIGRRVQNPLNEMIKVPSPSMGIGLYQHDIAEKEMKSMVERVVSVCVNRVGVDINTASFSILEYISGLNKTKAKSIIDHRDKNGNFTSRKGILKVKGIGPKTYEQCVGFLRIKEGKNPLDNTNIHPEVYPKVMELLENEKIDLKKLQESEYRTGKLTKKLAIIDVEECASTLDIGIPTLELILENLVKPALDPRDSLPKPVFRKGVLSIDNLTCGQQVTAVVRNVVDFGAFCDIGVKQDALLHKTEIPNCHDIFRALQVGDILQVSIKSIEKSRGRVGLSIEKEGTERKAGKDAKEERKEDKGEGKEKKRQKVEGNNQTKNKDKKEGKKNNGEEVVTKETGKDKVKDKAKDKREKEKDTSNKKEVKRKNENDNEKPNKKLKK